MGSRQEQDERTMKVVVVEQAGKVSVREVLRPVPIAQEVLVRLDHCLLCTWEQRMFAGTAKVNFPFVPGHEVAGSIVQIPEETITGFSVGEKVTVKTLDSCGHCEACYQGFDNLCTGTPRKRTYDGIPSSGGLAQYIALPVSRIFSLPDQDLDTRFAAFAEPLACCVHSIEQADIALGEDVVVVGAGIMGQFHVALSRARGARVIVVEPNKERAVLATKMGAMEIIDPFAEDATQRILKLTNGRGAHVVFTTITQTTLAELYIKALAKRGRIIYYGSFHPDGDIAVSPNMIHYSERVITGSYSPTTKAFYTAIRLISYGIIDVRPFLSAEYPLAMAQEAFRKAQDPQTYRVSINLCET